jgi:hypothetical protein
VAVLALVVADPVVHPTSAHPEGMPAHARLRAEGPTVHLTLTVAPDDAALLGERLGHLPDGAEEWYLERTDDEAQPTADQLRRFSRSAELRDHLLQHVQVRQDGAVCDGEVEPAPNFVREGAQLTFRCPEPVTAIDLRITLFHDEDDTYRTVSLAGTLDSYAHTVAEPEHRWEFDADEDGGGRVPAALPVGLAGVLLGSVGLVARGPWRARSRS